jgi:cytochrome c5
MTEKSYAKNLSIILALTAALMIFIFLLVAHHLGIPNKVREDRSALLGTRSSVGERIRPVGQVNLGQAQQEPAKTAEAPAKPTEAAPPQVRDGQQVYQTACVACHQAGVAGAPKFGDKAAWAPRIQLGMDSLYTSSLKGKGAMPPKGGQTAFSDAEVKAAVDYMVAQSK